MPNTISQNITKIVEVANRMKFNQKKMEVIANNLANIDTVGYKRDFTFTRVLKGEQEHITIKKKTDFSEGELVNTSDPLDVALIGDAFFVVTDGVKNYFTKNGNFNITEDGYLVDSDGYRVLGKNGPITIDNDLFRKEKNIKFSGTGEITLGKQAIDDLLIVTIPDKSRLIKKGGSKFELKDGSYEIAGEKEYRVRQGYLESSNVSPILEMEDMIMVSKKFESIQKVIRNYDEILNKANEIAKPT